MGYRKDVIDLIQKSNSIAIIPSKVAGLDAFAAAVGLYYMLKEKEKDVIIVHPGELPLNGESMVEHEAILSAVGKRELVVSVDYSNTHAEKVHYDTVNDTLFLSISPIDKDFDLARVNAVITGNKFDLLICIGGQEPIDFGGVYKQMQNEFETLPIICIDNTHRNTKFAAYNIINDTIGNLSLLTMNKAVTWNLNVTKKAANAFLIGINKSSSF